MRSKAVVREHRGELSVAIDAARRGDLFREAALVVSRACGRTDGPPGEWVRVSVQGRDLESLLVAWLNELIGRSERDGRAYGEVRHIVISDGTLGAEIRGRPVPLMRSPLKAATYHGLHIEHRHTRFRAEVLFDV